MRTLYAHNAAGSPTRTWSKKSHGGPDPSGTVPASGSFVGSGKRKPSRRADLVAWKARWPVSWRVKRWRRCSWTTVGLSLVMKWTKRAASDRRARLLWRQYSIGKPREG